MSTYHVTHPSCDETVTGCFQTEEQLYKFLDHIGRDDAHRLTVLAVTGHGLDATPGNITKDVIEALFKRHASDHAPSWPGLVLRYCEEAIEEWAETARLQAEHERTERTAA